MPTSPFDSAAQFPLQVSSLSDVLFLLALLLLIAIGGLFTVVKISVIQATAQTDGLTPDELRNCPSCGARTPLADETCDYCGERVPKDR